MQSICARAAVAAAVISSVSAHLTRATVCGDNSVIQLNSRGPCYYHDPSPAASLLPACSGSLAEILSIHIAANNTRSRSIEIYDIDTHNTIEPNTMHHYVLTHPVLVCATGALVDQFITKCWVVQSGEDLCVNATSACALLHSQGDAVFRDACAGVKPPRPFEWILALPLQMNGWVV